MVALLRPVSLQHTSYTECVTQALHYHIWLLTDMLPDVIYYSSYSITIMTTNVVAKFTASACGVMLFTVRAHNKAESMC